MCLCSVYALVMDVEDFVCVCGSVCIAMMIYLFALHSMGWMAEDDK